MNARPDRDTRVRPPTTAIRLETPPMLTHERTILHALSGRRSTLRTPGLTLGLVVVLGAWQFPRPTDDAFVAHLEEMLPALLHMTDVPGAAIALIEDGEVINLLGFGSADGDGKPIRPATDLLRSAGVAIVPAYGSVRGLCPLRPATLSVSLIPGGERCCQSVSCGRCCFSVSGSPSTPSLPWVRARSNQPGPTNFLPP